MGKKIEDLLDNYVPDGQKTEEQLAQEAAEQEAARKAEEDAEAERLKLEEEAKKSEEEEEGGEEGKSEEEPGKSFSELLKGVNPDTEEKKVEIPEEVLAELESYKTKLAAYESDPLVKAVTASATKEQLIAIAAELNGKDYSKSSYEDLIAAEIKSVTGFEGEELEEQVSLAMDEFNSLPKYRQIAAEKEIRDKFQATAKKGESPTLAALEAAYLEKTKDLKTPEQLQKELVEVAAKEKTMIKELGSKLVGSKLYGVEFTKEVLDEIIEKDYDVNKVADFVDNTGNLNIGEFIQAKFISKNLAKMIQLAEERGAKKANQGSSATTTTTGKAPIVHDKKNSKQQNLEGLLPDYIVKKIK